VPTKNKPDRKKKEKHVSQRRGGKCQPVIDSRCPRRRKGKRSRIEKLRHHGHLQKRRKKNIYIPGRGGCTRLDMSKARWKSRTSLKSRTKRLTGGKKTRCRHYKKLHVTVRRRFHRFGQKGRMFSTVMQRQGKGEEMEKIQNLTQKD